MTADQRTTDQAADDAVEQLRLPLTDQQQRQIDRHAKVAAVLARQWQRRADRSPR